MPRLSDTMEEGVLLSWLVDDGASVSIGEEIAEIETDKAIMTLSAESEGPLSQLAAAGGTFSVGTRIGWIGEDRPEGDTAPAASATPAEAQPAAPEAPPEAPRLTAARPFRASPLARRLAAELGVDLTGLKGTGPNGRIGKRDVERAADRAANPSTAAAAADAEEVRPLGRVQRLIAERMVVAQRTVPDFAVEIDVEMDAAAALRGELAALGEGYKVSFNDLIVKACALALLQHPMLNASYRDDEIVLHGNVHIGLAVTAPETLVVPVVRDADRLRIRELAAETRRLAGAVRDGEVAPADLGGGTFTVSNPGMLGVHSVTPIVNAGEAAILGVGAIREELARRDGEIVDRRVCRLRLSCDHRIVYGADGAAFLATVADLIQRPLSLLA